MFIISGTMRVECHLGLGVVTSWNRERSVRIGGQLIMDLKPVRQEEDGFSLGAALTHHVAQRLTFKLGLFLVHLLPVASCVRRFRKSQSKHHALYTVRC
jgi:hypothetical protein